MADPLEKPTEPSLHELLRAIGHMLSMMAPDDNALGSTRNDCIKAVRMVARYAEATDADLEAIEDAVQAGDDLQDRIREERVSQLDKHFDAIRKIVRG